MSSLIPELPPIRTFQKNEPPRLPFLRKWFWYRGFSSMAPKAIPHKATLPDFPLFPSFLALMVHMFRIFRFFGCVLLFSCVFATCPGLIIQTYNPRTTPHKSHLNLPIAILGVTVALLRSDNPYTTPRKHHFQIGGLLWVWCMVGGFLSIQSSSK